MSAKIFLTLSLLVLSGSAWAQRCPPGSPQTPACLPPDHPASPLNRGTQQPAAPRMIWADRWGAIATDATNGGVGTAVSMPSKRKAEKSAMTACHAKGGSGCKIALSYFNQCGAMAWGTSYATTTAAETIEEASENAITRCSEHTTDCQIYYADCSMAERIQ